MAGTTWDLVRGALAVRAPARVDDAVSTRAAVAVVLRDGPSGFEVLFIRRAEADGDPWSGQMGFPGGRAEPGEDLRTTAIRETAEETGIDLAAHGELLGQLDEVRAMARMRPMDLTITPFVFRLDGPATFVPNAEVRSVHWLPLDELLGSRWQSTMEYLHKEEALRFPCLRFDDLVIWGLTYRMFMGLRDRLEAVSALASPQDLAR
jgi:8-oxo-dGTP pyrophosphatase MutT (NUDIX family)